MPLSNVTAVILCAGRGRRLGALTAQFPKCLLDVGGTTILERCLDHLRAVGVTRTVLVTGYLRDRVEEAVLSGGYDSVRFIVNPRFDRSNTAVSLNLALKTADSDCLAINGDVVFERSILRDLVQAPAENAAVIDTDIPLDEEEVKVAVADGLIARIGKEIDPALCQGEAIGLYKIGRESLPDLIRVYDRLEAQGEYGLFMERGFAEVFGRGREPLRPFGPVPTLGRAWIEIDTPADYDNAQRSIAPRL